MLTVSRFYEQKQLKSVLFCLNCDTCLSIGITACELLFAIDAKIHELFYTDRLEYDEQLINALFEMYRRWYDKSRSADIMEWAYNVQNNGYHLDNLLKFKDCQRQVTALFNANSQSGHPEFLPDGFTALINNAIDEMDNGKTSGFVSSFE